MGEEGTTIERKIEGYGIGEERGLKIPFLLNSPVTIDRYSRLIVDISRLKIGPLFAESSRWIQKVWIFFFLYLIRNIRDI